MSLNLYISNNIDNLVEKLANNIDKKPLDVFQKEHIVVQTAGMSSWISIKIAEKNKIFGDFDFYSPNKLLFELFNIANIYNPGLYDTNNLKWIIFKILGEEEFNQKFHTTYLYFENDRIKRLQLATKLSDLFDQYIIYRPDYIKSWNDNKNIEIKKTLLIHEKWQKWIWVKVKDKLKNSSIDKVQMREQLLEKFNSDAKFVEFVKNKFPRISLFGFSIFTSFHIDVFLKALKDIVSVDFYLFNPSPEIFWFQDIKEKTKVKIESSSGKSAEELKLNVGNQLLMNQGRTAKDLFLMLFSNDEFLNVMDNYSLINLPKKDTLLHVIQNEIYFNTTNENRESIPTNIINDGTIEIASNYTLAREVETLYSYILKQIELNNVKLQEIIVQTTNIDIYTPYIKAVFDNASIKIPYTIADRSYNGGDNLIGILKELLSIQKDEFTSEDILQLLEYDVIREKFNISNIKTIRTLVKQANIRHGIDGDLKDDTILVSWKNGLNRIVLGYAISDQSLYSLPNTDHSIIPLDIVEGEYAKEGLKLKHFVDTLIKFTLSRSKPRKLIEWKDYIIDLTSSILKISDDNINDLNYILKKLSLSEVIFDMIDEKISYEVFFKAFIDSLYAENRNSRFISGGITFCSMIPMRSIPYRIVAILGLNSNSFPRKSSDVSFDLMTSEHRPGDRNIKETDKYLFFESLLSAKDNLYLSYLGKNIQDNSDNPPSIVIDELLDYIELKTPENCREILTKTHSINNHNEKYFDPQNIKYYTYLNYVKEQKIGFSSLDNLSEEIILGSNIRFKDLKLFYKNPVKWYFNKSLNIYYKEDEILLPETEVFELNNLEKFNLKREILFDDDNINIDKYLEVKRIKGDLPLKNMAKFEYLETKEKLQLLLKEYNYLKQGLESKSFPFEVDRDYTIYGEISNVYDETFILGNISSKKTPAIVNLQITRWLSAINDLPINIFILLHFNKKKEVVEKLILQKSDIEEAKKNITQLIKYYILGHKTFLPFYPQGSHDYLKKYMGKTRSVKSTFMHFMKQIEIDSKYDQYLKKAIEENVFKESDFEPENNLMLKVASLFFKDIFK